MREQTLSAGHARALLGTPDRELQEQLARRAVDEGLSVRATEELVRSSLRGDDSWPGSIALDEPAAAGGADAGSGSGNGALPVPTPVEGIAAGAWDVVTGTADGRPAAPPGDSPGRTGGDTGRLPGSTLRPPGVLELEELLADHLSTRVRVDMGARHGRVVIEFATLEDLERIYRLMIGDL